MVGTLYRTIVSPLPPNLADTRLVDGCGSVGLGNTISTVFPGLGGRREQRRHG